MHELKERDQIAEKDTWDLESVYASEEDWEQDYAQLKREVEAFGEKKGQIAADISALCPVLDCCYDLERRLERLAIYARMRSDQDTGNTFYQKMSSKAQSLVVAFEAQSAFLQPEILAKGREQLLEALKKDPALSVYERPIKEMIRGNEHTLAAEMEEILAEAGNMAEAPQKIFNVFMNADMSYPDAVLSDGTVVPVSNSSLITSLQSGNRELRRAVFQAYYSRLGSFGNTMAGLLEANVKQTSFYAKERRYSSNRASCLDGSNIPESVYDNLISEVHRALPAMYRYVAVRKKLLGVDELHMYDIYTPLFKAGDRRYTIEEAEEIVKEGLAPLGEEYQEILQEGFDSRWIDIYPNRGKRGGAYSWGCYDSKPFVLLNYQGTLDNVFTLAHEMGHSIHSYYSKKNQPFPTSGYRIFVAEVASTCNESLLIGSLLDKTDDRNERAYLLNHYLDSFKGTVFRQTMFAEFEMMIHRMSEEGTPLTADLLNETYYGLNRLYFGPDMISDEEIRYEWMRIPHFYTPFYVYQYATGFSAAAALSEKIRKEGETAVEAYKGFLKGGSSMDPIDLLKAAGVDMTTPKPVSDALAKFEQLVGELERLVAEM